MEEAFFFGTQPPNKHWEAWYKPNDLNEARQIVRNFLESKKKSSHKTPNEKEEPKLPVVYYTPPDNVDAIIRKGQYVCGVPVWDNNNALKALDKILALGMQYISKANTRNVAYKPEVDLERFFDLCNKSREALELLKRFEEENENKTSSENK